jgi:RNA polymerase sigma-70 factor (ECF subfamily)
VPPPFVATRAPIIAGDFAPRAEVQRDDMADPELVRRVLDGDGRAFTMLADRHAAACLRFATRMLGSREDAEDATQEALLRAYRALATYDGRTAFRTWLFAILVNRCRTTLLRRARRTRRIVTDEDAVSRAVASSEARSTELREELASALGRLDEDQREAFLLKHVEQLGYDEMAVVTGASVSALKMRVKRACAHLQDLLREGSDVRP